MNQTTNLRLNYITDADDMAVRDFFMSLAGSGTNSNMQILDREIQALKNAQPNQMIGATSSKGGEAGIAPAPSAGKEVSFLRGDATWADPMEGYDPDGTVKQAGGIPSYVQANAPKVTVEDSVLSTSATNAASSNAVKKAYDLAAAAIPAEQKGTANGVASLGVDGKLLSSQLPAGFSGVEILDSQVLVFGTGIGSGSLTDLNVVKSNGIVIVTGNLIFAPSQAKDAYSIGLSGLPPVAGRGLSIVDASWLIGETSKPTLLASASIQTNGITSNNGNSPMLDISFESNLGIQKYGLYMTLIYATT